MLYSLALMEHTTTAITENLLRAATPEKLLLYLADAFYSPISGVFVDLPVILTAIGTQTDTLSMVQQLDTRLIQPYTPRLANIMSRAFTAVSNVQVFNLALDK